MKEYRLIVFKNFGPFVFTYDTYEEAVDAMKDKWFSPGVWDIALFEDDRPLDVNAIMKDWETRPIYC